MPSADLAVYPDQFPRTAIRGPVRVREDVLFTGPKGEDKSAARNRAEQALDNLQDILGKLLEPQEAVLYIARAVAPLSFFEQFTLGWQAYHMYGTVLVFTNRRIIRFGVKGKGMRGWVWRGTLHSVLWGDIAEAKCKGFLSRTLRSKYRNGRKETYMRINGTDAKKIRSLVAALLPVAATEASAAQQMISHCPECVTPLAPRVYRCPQCQQDFKTEKALLWRSILIPGGGYYYVGWKGFAILFGLVELVLIFEIGSWVCIALGIIPPPIGPNRTTAGDAMAVAGFLLAMFALETLVVFLHMRRFVREFVPDR
ncbi:MAG: hypothetical protein GZ088_11585 [Acidipila sp.]|nr:hypothetical protein [Acidipila sp.]